MQNFFKNQQKFLVEEYIKPSGVTDPRVISAFLKVPRHKFVPPEYIYDAYKDIPLSIGSEQVITQPSLVAKMTELLELKGNEKVLEIGTGSGFQAAILSCLAKQVYSIERFENLAREAQERLKILGYTNVKVVVGDGTRGLPKYAPFEAIIVTAGAPEVPKPFVSQLKEGGRLVIPIGGEGNQILKVGVKEKGKIKLRDIESVRFVPLVGKYGW